MNPHLRILTGSVSLACIGLALSASPSLAAKSVRERTLIDAGWLFQKGDPAAPTDELAYPYLKSLLLSAAEREFPTNAASKGASTAATTADATPSSPANPATVGATVPYTQPGFDDQSWRHINLPHDWAIEGPFSQALPGDTGKLPWAGVGWYRKHFEVPASDKGRQVFLDIDGAMAYSEVWLNGKFVGGWPYGYSSYRLDLTPFLKPGAENVLAIRLNNPEQSSRWYPGSGIYRHVWLVKTERVHVAHWGTYITTPEVTSDSATLDLKITVENQGASEVSVNLATQVFEASADGRPVGKPVASFPVTSLKIAPGKRESGASKASLKAPKLWDTEKPNRYVAVTKISEGDKIVDAYQTPFGVRTIKFDADKGFFLNGKHVPIKGVCDHHDLGALGAAINTRALERQIDLLKEMGCNAIRTSHNPPAPELLDLCDRKGMLVMDESFDCWRAGKNKNDYHLLFDDWHRKDLTAEIHRDRNHPSIILWSLGNEVLELRKPEGSVIAAELTALANSEDPTRRTTVASNAGEAGFNGFQRCVNVFGYNYNVGSYAKFRKANPDIPLIGSETSSCVSSRGEYFFPVTNKKSEGKADFQVSSYDLYAPGWATTPDDEFKVLDENPGAAGEFVWTGFDYLGEPTPYNRDTTNLLNFSDPASKAKMQEELKALGKIKVPSRSSYFGIIDLAGFPKDRFFLYQARWRPELPMVHILPHWNWPERVGQVTPVFIYTSGDEAELFLNGKSLGRKKREQFQYRLRWDDVVYQPGELKAVAYKNGQKWAETVIKTTGPAAKVTLKADRSEIKADGNDLSFVTVSIADKNGLMVPRSKNLVKFEISGPGEIVGVDNGDATSFESFQAHERHAYNGLALVIIRSKPGQSGQIKLKATSEGLKPAEIPLRAEM